MFGRSIYPESLFWPPTVEDCYRKQILNDKPVLLEILDCAGEEEFSVLRDQWISSLQVLILAFSITDRSSLEELERYYLPQHVLRNKQGKEQNKDFMILLIGNKCGLEHQQLWNKKFRFLLVQVPVYRTIGWYDLLSFLMMMNTIFYWMLYKDTSYCLTIEFLARLELSPICISFASLNTYFCLQCAENCVP